MRWQRKTVGTANNPDIKIQIANKPKVTRQFFVELIPSHDRAPFNVNLSALLTET
jgi:hypothetical protein